jgi:tetratricopeptide (TPR) repeat protein
MTDGRSVLLRALGLLAAVLVVMSPGLTGGFIWDDGAHIIGNPAVTSWDGLRLSWLHPGETSQYYPLTFSLFWLLYHVFGLHAAGYHVVTALFHAANAILLGKLLERLSVRGAWLAALLFAVHPVQVMSVAWITELKNTLSGFFYLAALLAYWGQAIDRTGSSAASKKRVLVVLLYLLALLSKTSAASLPVVAGLLSWWRVGRIGWRDLSLLIPMLLLGFGATFIASSIEARHPGAPSPDWDFDGPHRVLLAGHAFWFYLGKLAWPIPQMFIYPQWTPDVTALSAWLFPFSAFLMLFALFAWSPRMGRGPFVAMILFFGQAPALVLWKVLYMFRYTTVSDHWVYLACIGPIALAACALSAVPRYRFALIVPLVLALGARTWTYAHTFRNIEVLWRHNLALNPACWLAHNNLGQVLLETDRPGEARHHFEEAVRLKPDMIEGYKNLGMLHARAGDWPNAVQNFEKAIALSPRDVDSRYWISLALRRVGRTADAEAHLRHALQDRPDSVGLHLFLAELLVADGRADEAAAVLQSAEGLPMNAPEIRLRTGQLWLDAGRPDRARAQFDVSLQMKPGWAQVHYELGRVAEMEGRTDEALQQYRRALELDSRALKVWLQASHLYLDAPDPADRDPARALELAQHAVDLAGGGEPASLYTLARALDARGDRTQAVAVARRALPLAQAAHATELVAAIEASLASWPAP